MRDTPKTTNPTMNFNEQEFQPTESQRPHTHGVARRNVRTKPQNNELPQNFYRSQPFEATGDSNRESRNVDQAFGMLPSDNITSTMGPSSAND